MSDPCRRCGHDELAHDCIDNAEGHFPIGCLRCDCSYYERDLDPPMPLPAEAA